MIRLDFPGFTGEGSLERIEWDEWFQKFYESGLALLRLEQKMAELSRAFDLEPGELNISLGPLGDLL